MLPNRIRVSERASSQLKLLKGRTGLTPNVISRIALMNSLKDDCKLMHKPEELNGLEFNSITLFGDYIRLYEALILRYQISHEPAMPMTKLVPSLIESGLQALGHVKQLDDLISASLK